MSVLNDENINLQGDFRYSIWCFPEIDTLGFEGFNSSGHPCFYVMRNVFRAISNDQIPLAEKIDVSAAADLKDAVNTFFQSCFNVSTAPKNN